MKLAVGNKIYFAEEKRPYIVKACNDRFAICTKPYNPKHTVLYTILDLKENIRGTDNLVFNLYDYSIQNDINECLKDLQEAANENPVYKYNGLTISHKNQIPINIIKII